ncbi:MAG: hypothetical protein U9Q22_05505 [Candidatus Altiarchaeota archaeon]|nr:hypothetical protein [Candidatus Altiarchaeota archaeon]
MKNKKIQTLSRKFPKTYSQELGINTEKNWGEIFKWFIASLLFGKRITENTAKKTYREFRREGLLTPKGISEAGWDKLVEVLDAGGYARYDFSTATRLLDIMKGLEKKGGLENLYKESENSRELEQKLKEFKGIGDVTTNIFLRELRFMSKIDPEISEFIKISAKNLDIDLNINRKTKEFIHLESALLRLGKDYCRKNKCKKCPVTKYCKRKNHRLLKALGSSTASSLR